MIARGNNLRVWRIPGFRQGLSFSPPVFFNVLPLAFLLAGLSLLILPTGLRAQTGSGDGFNYSINASNANTITVTGYTGNGGTVTIPTNINNLLVTGIGVDAFYSSALTSVTIPAGVTSIGNQAFSECSSLTEITVDSQNSYYSSETGLV